MPFEHCKVCKKCCHVDPGYPSLEVPLLAAEQKRWKQLVIDTSCRFLGASGCDLGSAKPFACEQYPLSYDPDQNRYYFDADCPLFERYQDELRVDGSQAQEHFERIRNRIDALRQRRSTFLARNFALDTDYFELVPLEVPQKLIGPTKT